MGPDHGNFVCMVLKCVSLVQDEELLNYFKPQGQVRL